MAKKLHDLQAKLKAADPEIRAYVAELERRNGKLQAENLDCNNRIKALQKVKPGDGLDERLRRARERDLEARLEATSPANLPKALAAKKP